MGVLKTTIGSTMRMLIGKKTGVLCSATALALSLATSVETASMAATASATARLKVIPSIISLSVTQQSQEPKDKKNCENSYLSFYLGKDDGATLISQRSPQCSSVYEIPAQAGSIIVLP